MFLIVVYFVLYRHLAAHPHIVKPTKITSIDVELTATASLAWLEGDTLSKLILFLCMLIISNLIGSGAESKPQELCVRRKTFVEKDTKWSKAVDSVKFEMQKFESELEKD